jgi:hypothetical protein
MDLTRQRIEFLHDAFDVARGPRKAAQPSKLFARGLSGFPLPIHDSAPSRKQQKRQTGNANDEHHKLHGVRPTLGEYLE